MNHKHSHNVVSDAGPAWTPASAGLSFQADGAEPRLSAIPFSLPALSTSRSDWNKIAAAAHAGRLPVC